MPRNLRITAGAQVVRDAWRAEIAISIPWQTAGKKYKAAVIVENTTDRHFFTIDRALLNAIEERLAAAERLEERHAEAAKLLAEWEATAKAETEAILAEIEGEELAAG